MTDERDGSQILALCAGYGGLEAAIRAGIGGQVVAFAENDPHAAAVFAAHHPNVPNLGDITAIDWRRVRDLYAPDVVGAGFPCRNISNAGRRDGIHGKWSRVWKNVAEAVGELRPRLVFLENVAALRSRGLDVVAADLAALGYDVRWTCLRAGDPEVGAPHPRDRWFAVAHPTTDADPHRLGRHWRPRHVPETQGRQEPAHRGDQTPAPASGGVSLLPTPVTRDWKSGASNLLGRNARPLNEVVVNLLSTPKASDQWITSDGTDYGPAIRRWEHVTGRAAPCPTEPGTRGNRRLAPAFVEWLMGLSDGWVTAVPGIPRKEQLKILGNGVVPQQAYRAYALLMTWEHGMEEEKMTDETMTDTEQDPAEQEKPRGICPGDRCGFEYQLTAKGMIRKHMARVGPGLCDGAGKPPKDATGDATEPGEEPITAPTVFIALAEKEVQGAGTVALPPSATAPIPVTEAAPQLDQFTDPTPAAIPDESVSGQPEPERDRWGRYVLDLGGPKRVRVTRATTFAKSYSDTFSLSEWGNRMVVRGLTLRPDLVALAHGLEVKRDKDALNSIAEQAREAAGQKVAANLGTAIHSFTERLDAGVMTQAEVPQPYQYHTSLYAARVAEAGLTTRPQWIERTTSVLVRGERPGVQEQVAGTLDRIFRLPSGELVIGDLKTGASLEYGWGEIAVQLALYAHGVNERGLYDHRTKSWQPPMDTVREDFAIVMHLPADPTDGGKHPGREAFCELYYVDLTVGWADASLCADVRSRRKAKGHARPLLKEDISSRPAPGTPPSMMDFARAQFSSVTSMDQAAQLYQQAVDSGQFTEPQLWELGNIGSNALDLAHT